MKMVKFENATIDEDIKKNVYVVSVPLPTM